jgi:hypothetical protein
MKITPSVRKNLSSWRHLPVFLMLGFLPFHSLQSQCTLNCTNIQLSLDEDCASEVTWQMLMNGNQPPGCAGPLIVEVRDENNVLLPASPVVTGEYANRVLTGRVIDQASGNSCWGTITVEDKLKPKLTCKDTLVSCFHSTAPATTGFPVVVENCIDTLAATFTDNVAFFSCTSTDTISIISRLWTATDSSGNTGFCIQKIFVERPDLDDIKFPANRDNMSEPALYCGSANTSPDSCGAPSFNGVPVDSVCSFLYQYEDVEVPVCDGSYTVFREWTVYDGCAAQSRTEEQIIEVLDTLAPQLVCPADITVNTSNLDCTATVLLPQPATFDSCSSTVIVTVEGSFGIITGNAIYNLERGIYEATCRSTDDCGNSTTCLFYITVEDNVPPVAVAVPSANVALLPTQPTHVNAATFDGGSWDNCGTLTRQVRRLDSPHCPGNDSTPFGATCPFFCCDAGKTVMVELRVTDVEGNASTVMTSAQVVDNLNPGIVCPANKTLNCGTDFTNLSLTGQPTATDNCTGFTVTHSDAVNINNCGVGLVVRTWTVEDASGRTATCTQNIALENLSPFYINTNNPNDPNDDIVWPANFTSNTCGAGLAPNDLPPGFGFPEITADPDCSLIAVSYSDTWLTQPNNACIEILRTWIIIDWCQFNQSTYAGSWQYGQIIKIQNSTFPEFTSACSDQEFCSLDSDCETGPVTLSATATDDCTTASQLKFTYKIDLNDDGTTDHTGAGSQVSGNFSIGTHRATFTVEDGCHNKSTCTWLFTVKDCKKPSPKCKGFTAQIMSSADPAVEILAGSFNDGSSDNCTAAGDLIFSFSENTDDTVRIFKCADLGMNEVELWVTDEEGNQDFCLVEIEIQGNSSACLGVAGVSGNIMTEDSNDVALVVVKINDPTLLASAVTDTTGNFSFDNLAPGADYTITPSKNTKPTNGVTTFDLVLITRHILGTQLFNSPYKIIAADVNRSGSVTTFDLVQLRKMILFIDLDFPNNTSWRFVKRDFQFSNPLNPFADNFPEVASFNDLAQSVKADFIAIKVGDVNGSANVEE